MATPSELRAIQLAKKLSYNNEVIALDVQNFCASLGVDVPTVEAELVKDGVHVVSYEAPAFKAYYAKARMETQAMARVAKLQNLHAKVRG